MILQLLTPSTGFLTFRFTNLIVTQKGSNDTLLLSQMHPSILSCFRAMSLVSIVKTQTRPGCHTKPWRVSMMKTMIFVVFILWSSEKLNSRRQMVVIKKRIPTPSVKWVPSLCLWVQHAKSRMTSWLQKQLVSQMGVSGWSRWLLRALPAPGF